MNTTPEFELTCSGSDGMKKIFSLRNISGMIVSNIRLDSFYLETYPDNKQTIMTSIDIPLSLKSGERSEFAVEHALFVKRRLGYRKFVFSFIFEDEQANVFRCDAFKKVEEEKNYMLGTWNTVVTLIKKSKIDEIVEWARNNNNSISRRMFIDILRDKNTDISDLDLEQITYRIEQQGIHIAEVDEEDYPDSDSNENPSSPADVNISRYSISLDNILNRIKYREIDLNPDFQRRPDLWNKENKSRLIESLMLKIPIPSFYFDASDDGNWLVIDGLQRLSAIKGFILDKSFALTGLEFLTDLKDLTFDQLPRIYSRRILETQLTIYTVEKGTPKRIVFNIFKRLNTGGIMLSPQEIRNALNQGDVISLVRDMAICDEFKEATDYSIKSSRMLDYEYAVRFIAFTRNELSDYNGNIDDFLNLAMEWGNKTNAFERKRVLDEYKRSLAYCKRIWGKYSFRRIDRDGKRGPINKALFETFTREISKHSDIELDILVHNKQSVLYEYKEFVEMVAPFLKAGDKYTVNRRIIMVNEFIERLINAYKD